MDACAQRTDPFTVDDAQSVNPLLVTECDVVGTNSPIACGGNGCKSSVPSIGTSTGASSCSKSSVMGIVDERIC